MHAWTRSAAAVVVATLIVVIAGCVRAPSATPSAGPVRLDASADGTTVELAPGAKLVVALEGNPTTGFDWKVSETLPAQLTAAGDSFEATAATGVVGAGGTRVFTYTAAAPGTGELDLEYVRAWEKGVPPQETLHVTVVVK